MRSVPSSVWCWMRSVASSGGSSNRRPQTRSSSMRLFGVFLLRLVCLGFKVYDCLVKMNEVLGLDPGHVLSFHLLSISSPTSFSEHIGSTYLNMMASRSFWIKSEKQNDEISKHLETFWMIWTPVSPSKCKVFPKRLGFFGKNVCGWWILRTVRKVDFVNLGASCRKNILDLGTHQPCTRPPSFHIYFFFPN